MRAVIQRVKSASVKIDNVEFSSIKEGLLLFLGIEDSDSEQDISYIVDKTINLRIFEDAEGKMNNSILSINGSVMIVSQFTLYGDARNGRRPSFIKAARPEKAIPLYEKVVSEIGAYVNTATGQFQAQMEISLINDGPVTILLDSKKLF